MVVQNQRVGVGRGLVGIRVGIDAVNLIVISPRGDCVRKRLSHILVVVVTWIVGGHLSDQHLIDIEELSPAIDMGDVLAERVGKQHIVVDAEVVMGNSLDGRLRFRGVLL